MIISDFWMVWLVVHYARFWRLTPSLKISRSSDQDENRTSRSQTLKVTCVKVSAQKSKVFGDSDFLKKNFWNSQIFDLKIRDWDFAWVLDII